MKKVPGKYFWLLMTITGALMFGAPALVSASEGIASTDTENSAADNAADTPDDDTIAKTTDSAEKNSQETDHSGEGQISKPKYLENAENNGEEIISDEDPTDNTYGYYTIMGGTTVSVDEMCSLYNSQGCTYPSEELSGGGASDIDTFCNIIVEEANAENVRGEVVFAQAMLETGWLSRPVQFRRSWNNRRWSQRNRISGCKNRNTCSGSASQSLRLHRFPESGMCR